MSETDHPTFRLTKIVATIGPACDNPQLMAKLIEQGLRVVRLNFSHGTLDDHRHHVQVVRQASQEMNTPIALLGDLAGPRIRLKQVAGGEMALSVGDLVAFDENADQAHYESDTAMTVLAVNHPPLVREVEPGHRVLIDDGHVRMLALRRDEHLGGARLICRVTTAGPISDRKGLNLPDTRLSMPSLTDYDVQCVDWAIEQGLDYLALSFVRRRHDIEQLTQQLESRAMTGRGGAKLPIIAKIETPQALEDLESIIEAADGVMVARGDLGVEMPPWDVPIIQKRTIRRAHDYGKPVIVATQMLQSMVHQPSATRAEVSDVANAVIDGADAVMLSGETAIGSYPEAAVQVMGRTALAAEQHNIEQRDASADPPLKLQQSRYRTAALAHGVNVVVSDLHARCVVMWSELGGGARYLSQNRLGVPIFAVSSNPAALRQMCLMFGVQPIEMQRPGNTRDFLDAVDRLMLDREWAEPGDPVVIAIGQPIGTPGVTNELRIHYIGDVSRLSS